MGHEAFGTIEAVGRGVEDARLGELVVIEPNVPCRDCPECRRGPDVGVPAADSRSGMNRAGALAEKVVASGPPRLARRSASTRGISSASSRWRSSRRRSGGLPGGPPGEALVVGAGAQGLLMSLSLLRRGVSRPRHGPEPGPGGVRDRQARRNARWTPTTSGGSSFVVDTTGAPDAVATAIRRSAVGATILELGLDRRPFELSAETLVRRQLVLRGSLTYDHPDDFGWAISLVELEGRRARVGHQRRASLRRGAAGLRVVLQRPWEDLDPSVGTLTPGLPGGETRRGRPYAARRSTR